MRSLWEPSAHRKLAWSIALAAGALFLWRTFLPSLTAMTHSYPAYYTASRLVLEGRWSAQVYDDNWFSARVLEMTDGRVSDRFSLHPPTTSLLLAPIAWLPIQTARLLWQGFNLVCLAGALWLLLNGLEAPRGGVRLWLLAGALLFPPLAENLRVGQTYTMLLLLFSISLWGEMRAERGQTDGSLWSGAALGLAMGLKLSGVPVWLALAARGRWRTLVTAGVVVLLSALLGWAVLGGAGWAAFFQRVLGSTQPPPLAAHVAFQTTPSFFQHLFVASPDFNPTPLFNAPQLASVFTLAVSLGALGATTWAARRAELETGLSSAVALSVILFPYATEYHYTLLLLPLAVMSIRVIGHRARADWVWLGVVLVLLYLPFDWNASYWNERAFALLAYPRLYGGWLLWLWLFKQMLAPSAARAALPLVATP